MTQSTARAYVDARAPRLPGHRAQNATSPGRRHLGSISKRGDVYLRCLLVHGARSVLWPAQRKVRTAPERATAFQHWAVTLAARRGHTKAVVAVANRLARLIWAVWHHDVDFSYPTRGGVAA